MARRFQSAGQRPADAFRIGEDDPACRRTILPGVGRRSHAPPPGHLIKQVVRAGSRLVHFFERQQANGQSFQLGHRPLRRVVNPNVDHLRIVFLDTPQRSVHPCLVDAILIAAKSC